LSQLKKGAFLNYATIITTNVVGLLLTPFIIRQLGDAEFGLYTLIGAFVGYISVLDFGLYNTIVRFVAKLRAEGDRKGEENFLASTMLIYGVISLLVLIIGTVCYFNIETIFADSLTGEEIEKAKIMFILMVFSLAIGLPGNAFEGICYGYERFVFPKSVKLVRYISRSVLVIAVLLFGGKAISMVVLDVVLNLIVIGTLMRYSFRDLKIKFKLHEFQTKIIKEIFSYSIWIFMFVLIGQFQWKVGQMVLGVVADTTSVAIFAVGVMLGTYYGAFSTAISGVFLPRATQMTVGNASPTELTDMMIKIGRLSFMILMFILGGFLLFGKQFVLLWVGDSYTDSWLIALIIMIAYTLPLVQAFGNSILEAQNKLAFKAIIYLIFLILGTGFGAYLARDYGAVGMIAGSVTGWMIVQNVMNFYYYKVIKLNIPRFFKEVASKILPTFLLVLGIGYLIDFIPGQGWFNLGIKIAIYSIIFGSLIYAFGMIEFERDLFRNLVKTIKVKLR